MLRTGIGRLLLMKRFVVAVAALIAMPVAAQTPAPPPASPDTPTFRDGSLIFGDYTYQSEPEVVDADGNRVNLSQFNVGRAYINVTGNLNRRFQYRITP